MKKIAIVLMTVLALTFCKSGQPVKKNDNGVIVITDKKGKKVGEIPLNKLRDLNNVAMRYVALQKDLKNKKLTKKDIKVKQISKDRYAIAIKLTKKLTATVYVRVNTRELEDLRRIMKNLTTKEPNVTAERIGRTDKFKITFSMENIVWTKEIDIKNLKKWNWSSFWAGLGVSSIMAALGAAAKANAAKLMFVPLL